jgi:hypothetical protein
VFKCPKCRGGDFMINESVVVLDWIEVVGGRVSERGRGEPCAALGFTAKCRCGHTWNMRRKTGYAAVEAAMELET